MEQIPEDSHYIGDGVYIKFDGYAIIAMTQRAGETIHKDDSIIHYIAFEPAMIEELYRYYKSL